MALTDTSLERTGLERAGAPAASVGDYAALLKPRVMSLVVFTALVGMTAAPGGLHPLLAAIALAAIAIGAGASGALNMWYDADVDARMARTARRPIPAGRVPPEEALAFGLVLAILSVMVLGLAANWLAAALLAFTILFYAVVYTMWLKRWTAQNIVIGGAAGALPPVIGWAAASGTVALEPLVLFLVIFLWTPPHFWALALFKRDDYARAGLPMLPVVKGARATRRAILAYSLVLAPVALLPSALGHAGIAYGLAALALGMRLIWLAVAVARDGAASGERAAKRLFAFSIVYLFALFAVRLAEILAARLMAG